METNRNPFDFAEKLIEDLNFFLVRLDSSYLLCSGLTETYVVPRSVFLGFRATAKTKANSLCLPLFSRLKIMKIIHSERFSIRLSVETV
jgi:hypothetical protein